jgi:hypothetical protein
MKIQVGPYEFDPDSLQERVGVSGTEAEWRLFCSSVLEWLNNHPNMDPHCFELPHNKRDTPDAATK